jgi:AcrR family transcriptional regulator
MIARTKRSVRTTKARDYSDARDRDARTRILDAANELFQRDGFRLTSMDAIAEAARTSKRTLYACFANKHAVLESALIEFADRGMDAHARLSATSPDHRIQMITFGRELRKSAISDYSLSMYRMLLAEAKFLPSVARRTHRKGSEQLAERFREPLKSLGIDNHLMVGRLFYDLFVLAPVQRRLVGAADDMIDVEAIVDLILNGMKPQ